MVSTIAIVLVALPLYWLYSTYTSLQKNVKAAKLSGLPCVVTRERFSLEIVLSHMLMCD